MYLTLEKIALMDRSQHAKRKWTAVTITIAKAPGVFHSLIDQMGSVETSSADLQLSTLAPAVSIDAGIYLQSRYGEMRQKEPGRMVKWSSWNQPLNDMIEDCTWTYIRYG